MTGNKTLHDHNNKKVLMLFVFALLTQYKNPNDYKLKAIMIVQLAFSCTNQLNVHKSNDQSPLLFQLIAHITIDAVRMSCFRMKDFNATLNDRFRLPIIIPSHCIDFSMKINKKTYIFRWNLIHILWLFSSHLISPNNSSITTRRTAQICQQSWLDCRMQQRYNFIGEELPSSCVKFKIQLANSVKITGEWKQHTTQH